MAYGSSEKFGTPAMVDGVYFESVTEAMWYDYFKAAGMDPVPQPDSFRLYSGDIYTPDFYLPAQDTYVEVKWGNFEYDTANKAQYLACETGCTVMLIDGRPLDPDTVIRLMSADGDVELLYASNMSPRTTDDHTSYPPTFKLGEILPAGLFKNAVIRVDTQIDPLAKQRFIEARDKNRYKEQDISGLNFRERSEQKRAHDKLKESMHPAWYDNLVEDY